MLTRTGPSAPEDTASRLRLQAGASLIEILVAALILSLGLLGLAGMQARALRASISSEQRTQAIFLSHYLLDLMRVDQVSALQGVYNTPGGLSNPACAASALPTPAINFAQTELRVWVDRVKASIGTANPAKTCVAVDCTQAGVCTVRLHWDDSPAGGLADQAITVTSRL